MRKLLILLAVLMGTTLMWAQESKYPIEVKKLPDLATRNLKSYFPGIEVTEVYSVTQKIKDEYFVVLDNSVLVVFDKHGQWSRVEANDAEIPERMIDGRIKMDMAKNKITSRVIKMEKDKKGNYEVLLEDGTQLHYDNQFKPMK
jgi:hypothetical protein